MKKFVKAHIFDNIFSCRGLFWTKNKTKALRYAGSDDTREYIVVITNINIKEINGNQKTKEKSKEIYKNYKRIYCRYIYVKIMYNYIHKCYTLHINFWFF